MRRQPQEVTDIASVIERAIARGYKVSELARRAGINRTTLSEWLRQAAAGALHAGGTGMTMLALTRLVANLSVEMPDRRYGTVEEVTAHLDDSAYAALLVAVHDIHQQDYRLRCRALLRELHQQMRRHASDGSEIARDAAASVATAIEVLG